MRPDSSHSVHGPEVARSRLTSSSSMIRPFSVSTRNIRPGRSRPLRTTFAAGTSMTPVSLPITMRPSSVTRKRPGRSPLRSSVAPTSVPSVKVIAAGPSHGSMSIEWYS